MALLHCCTVPACSPAHSQVSAAPLTNHSTALTAGARTHRQDYYRLSTPFFFS